MLLTSVFSSHWEKNSLFCHTWLFTNGNRVSDQIPITTNLIFFAFIKRLEKKICFLLTASTFFFPLSYQWCHRMCVLFILFDFHIFIVYSFVYTMFHCLKTLTTSSFVSLMMMMMMTMIAQIHKKTKFLLFFSFIFISFGFGFGWDRRKQVEKCFVEA